MKRLLRRFLPKRIGPMLAVKRIYYFPVDALDWLLGRKTELLPPRGRDFSGRRDFREVGEKYLNYFMKLAGLKPGERVLDVGCGIGRMAVPLTGYLSEKGSYEGFDVVPDGIKWCRKKITPKYPNFRFHLADIYNDVYNPKGNYKASEYKFPFECEHFDFVFLTSVFTHMLPEDMENYFSEISRTLKKGGRCFITFYLLNAESLRHIDAKSSHREFRHSFGNCRVVDRTMPESAIAYEEAFVRKLYEKYSLNIVEPIHYGSWCGRDNFLDYQDIVVGLKNRAVPANRKHAKNILKP